MDVERVIQVTNRLEDAACQLPWEHSGRMVIRDLIRRLLDEAMVGDPKHPFSSHPLLSAECALCGRSADSHLEWALTANVEKKLRLVKLEAVEEFLKGGAL